MTKIRTTIILTLKLLITIGLQSQSIFSVTTTPSHCLQYDGSIKLSLLEVENPIFPVPYTVELEDAVTGVETYYDMTTDTLLMSNLDASDYLITVYFNSTCKLNIEATVGAIAGLTNKLIYLDNYTNKSNSSAACDGSITIGHNPIYENIEYRWVGNGVTGIKSPSISGLCNGTYTIIASYKECSQSLSQDLCTCEEEPEISNSPLSCKGYQAKSTKLKVTPDITFCSTSYKNDGSIKLSLKDGFGTYYFKWQGPNGYTSSYKDIENLAEGKYMLQVYNGCGLVNEQVIELKTCNSEDKYYLTFLGNTCGNSKSGSVVLLPIKNTLEYQWINPISNAFVISNLDTGYYCVRVKNTLDNCIKNECFEIMNGTSPEIEIVPPVPTCDNPATGYVKMHLLNEPFANLKIVLDKNRSFEKTLYRTEEPIVVLSGLPTGSYRMTATSSCGAENEYFFNIDSIDSNTRIKIKTKVTTGEDFEVSQTGTGKIEIDVSGGTDTVNLSYTWYIYTDDKWQYFAATKNIGNLYSGKYQVRVYDSGTGCISTPVLSSYGYNVINKKCEINPLSAMIVFSDPQLKKCSDPPFDIVFKELLGVPPFKILINGIFWEQINANQVPKKDVPSTWITKQNQSRGETKIEIFDDCGRYWTTSKVTCPKCDYKINDKDQKLQKITFKDFPDNFFMQVHCPCSYGVFSNCFWTSEYIKVIGTPPPGFKFSFVWPLREGKTKQDTFHIEKSLTGVVKKSGIDSWNLPSGSGVSNVTVEVITNNNCTMFIPVSFRNEINVINYRTKGSAEIVAVDKCELCYINGNGGALYTLDGACTGGEIDYKFVPNDPFAGRANGGRPDFIEVCNSGGKFETYVYNNVAKKIEKKSITIPPDMALDAGDEPCVWGGYCIFNSDEIHNLPLGINTRMPWCHVKKIEGGIKNRDTNCVNINWPTFNSEANFIKYFYNSKAIVLGVKVVLKLKGSNIEYETSANFKIGDNNENILNFSGYKSGLYDIEFIFAASNCNQKFEMIIPPPAIVGPDKPKFNCIAEHIDIFKDEHTGQYMVAEGVSDSADYKIKVSYIHYDTYEIISEYITLSTSIKHIDFVRTDSSGHIYLIGTNRTKDSTIIEKYTKDKVLLFTHRIGKFIPEKVYISELESSVKILGKHNLTFSIEEYTMSFSGVKITHKAIPTDCIIKGAGCYNFGVTYDDQIITTTKLNKYNIVSISYESETKSIKLDSIIKLKYVEHLVNGQYIVAGEYTGVYVNDSTFIQNDSIRSSIFPNGKSLIFYWTDENLTIIKTRVIANNYVSYVLESVVTNFYNKIFYTYYQIMPSISASSLDTCGLVNGIEFLNLPINSRSVILQDHQALDKDDEIKMYPIPFSSLLSIEINSQHKENCVLKLYNNLGVLVREQEYNIVRGENKLTFENLQNLSNGIYNLVFSSIHTQFTNLVIKAN